MSYGVVETDAITSGVANAKEHFDSIRDVAKKSSTHESQSKLHTYNCAYNYFAAFEN